MHDINAILEKMRAELPAGPVTIKNAADNGTKIIGGYCAYTPYEVIRAAGAIPVSLCATSEKPIAASEEHLPRNLCPLIKASYGFALTDTCPYFHFCDLVIGETTCDGKKKCTSSWIDFAPSTSCTCRKVPFSTPAPTQRALSL